MAAAVIILLRIHHLCHVRIVAMNPLTRVSRTTAILVSLLMLSACGSKAAESSFVTAKVDRGRISARVTASGTLSALVTVQVGSQVSGRIQNLYVDYNSPVKKGQLIAQIDPQLYQATADQANANLMAANANLAKAKVQNQDTERQAKRADELVAQKLISQAERDTARANADAAAAGVSAAEGAVAQTRAALNQTRVNLGYTRIVSPTDGVVISRSVDVGQTVAASLQTPTLFVIAQDLREMQVDTNVAESDIGKLTEGMDVKFTVDAYPGERFKGSVRQIRNAAQTVQNVVTYDAVIAVDNSDLRLRPGMTANVTFAYADKADVLRVPNAALRYRPSAELLPKAAETSPKAAHVSGQRTLWLLRAGQPLAVTVKLGISDGSQTEIAEGDLKEGDDVITDQRGDSAAKARAPRLF
jgi:HlyD family secretion protein